jgi:hypothetical protein
VGPAAATIDAAIIPSISTTRHRATTLVGMANLLAWMGQKNDSYGGLSLSPPGFRFTPIVSFSW